MLQTFNHFYFIAGVLSIFICDGIQLHMISKVKCIFDEMSTQEYIYKSWGFKLRKIKMFIDLCQIVDICRYIILLIQCIIHSNADLAN